MRLKKFKTLLPLLAIVLLFVINLWVLSATNETWGTGTKMHFELEHHLNSLRQDLNTGYLWLEHSLHENEVINYEEKVAANFTRAIESNEAFIKTSRQSGFDGRLSKDFTAIQKELLAFSAMANDFWKNSRPCPPGSPLDTAFKRLLENITAIDTHSNIENRGISKKLDDTFTASLVILFVANSLMIIMLYLFNRSKEEYEEAFKEQKDALATLFERSFDGVLMMEDNVITDCNTSMVNMLRHPGKKEMLKAKISELSPEFQPDGRASFQKFAEMVQIALKQRYHRFEWVFGKSNGETFYAEVVITPLSMGNKQLLHVVCQDISQRKALEESLQHKNTLYKNLVKELDNTVKERTGHMLQQSRLAQMGEMISMIAHQWRQPLSSISAISGTLMMDVIMDEYKKEFFRERLDAISGLSQHLSATIDDFRGFFKEAKAKENVTWKELTEASLKIIGPTLATKEITVHTRFEEGKSIHTYPNEVRQVILNIIKNAEEVLLDHETPDAQIWISSSAKNSYSCLCIEDNGGGVPQEFIDKIFDPYFSTKEKKDGTGLGLYMSKTIIEEHCGGRLSVRNTQHGALFEITLPISGD